VGRGGAILPATLVVPIHHRINVLFGRLRPPCRLYPPPTAGAEGTKTDARESCKPEELFEHRPTHCACSAAAAASVDLIDLRTVDVLKLDKS